MKYVEPEMKVLELDVEIICNSGGIDMPDIPFGEGE